jgi:hypothetical protein
MAPYSVIYYVLGSRISIPRSLQNLTTSRQRPSSFGGTPSQTVYSFSEGYGSSVQI